MVDRLIVFLVQEVKFRNPEFHQQCKVSDEQLVLGDLHFFLVQSRTESLKRFGRAFIGVVRHAHLKYHKNFLKKVIKDAAVEESSLLTSKYEGVYLCSLGYKYRKSDKTITFILQKGRCN